jgi:hypothetical protein
VHNREGKQCKMKRIFEFLYSRIFQQHTPQPPKPLEEEEDRHNASLDSTALDDESDETYSLTSADSEDEVGEAHEYLTRSIVANTRPVVYVLRLTGNKYYIGKSDSLNYEKRLQSHMQGNGSAWTKKYGVLDVAETIKEANMFTEDNTTLVYMRRHGIDNVRGGMNCNTILTENQVNSIKRALASMNDECYECGESGHFASNCQYSGSKRRKTNCGSSVRIKGSYCTICQRKNSHYAADCFANTDNEGNPFTRE